MKVLRVSKSVYVQIVNTLGKFSPECGGVLGAGDDGIITEFFFDETGKSTPTGYTPDVAAINDMLINDWMPRGILMSGIVHSHSNRNTVPSCGDIGYGIRILQALDTVDRFYLPIVTTDNGQVKMDCYVVCHDKQYGFVCRTVEWDIVDEQNDNLKEERYHG